MRFGIGLIFALLLMTAAQAKTPAPTFSAKVESSIRSLEDAADKAFVKTWAEHSDTVSAAGATATQVRLATRWIISAYSLGLCKANDRDLAAWYTKFDSLSFGKGSASPDLREILRQLGSESLDEGRQGSELDELTPTEKAGLCSVELEAVRRVLANL